jgi:hypothetical protein
MGRVVDFEMGSSAPVNQKKLANPSFVFSFHIRVHLSSVFVPHTFSEGRELERRRIRNELHKRVSQQLRVASSPIVPGEHLSGA